jgi:hypothetical protein
MRLKLGYNRSSDFVYLVTRSMELKVGDRAWRTAHRFARHSPNKT